MENNWEPRVGQKVVALRDGRDVRKGNEYTVLSVSKLCSHFVIDVGIKVPFDCQITCTHCGTFGNLKAGDPWTVTSSMFAPISEQYADMTAEIAQQFKEHPDTVDQPVKVLETSN